MAFRWQSDGVPLLDSPRIHKVWKKRNAQTDNRPIALDTSPCGLLNEVLRICHKYQTLVIIGPRRKKTFFRGFRQSDLQTSLLSYRGKLEKWNFARSKSR